MDLKAITFEVISKTEGKHYPLLIAIQDYADQNIVKLDNPIKDATRLKQTLTTYYTFDSEPQYMVLLSNPKRSDLIIAFEKITAAVTTKDSLLIFYAGHGYFDDKTERGYWLPADAVKKD